MAPPCPLGEVGLDIDRCITLYLTIALTPTLLTPNSSLVKNTTKIPWNNNLALDQYFMEIQSPPDHFPWNFGPPDRYSGDIPTHPLSVLGSLGDGR